MSRLTAVALRCYPPSWQERYGAELAELTSDGDTADLLVGAARAWFRPAGPRTAAARRLSSVSTVYVSWCAALVGTLLYVKAVNDPPLPGLTTGASRPLWDLVEATFLLGWLLVLVGGTALLVRIGVPAVRARNWPVLRPMLPAAVLLAVVLGTIPVLGVVDHASAAGVTVVLTWLALGFCLVVAGAVGPVVALRRSRLPADALRLPMAAGAGVGALAVALAGATAGQAAILSTRVDLYNLVMIWGGAAVIVVSAAASAVSVGRALHAR